MFSLVVSAYVLSAVGVPVYFHYCGGELEKVNYVVKSDSCCGGEEDDSATESNDCCKDENGMIINTTDFTIKQLHAYAFVKTFCDLFYIRLPFSVQTVQEDLLIASALTEKFPPPKLQAGALISTSVLRI